jgi:deazaflavin-dependent oxidoreductase (nitroreductase family)
MENKARNVRSGKGSSPLWLMNKVANPFVRLLLSSRLHGLLSPSLLLITYRGRKSGKKVVLPVQYVRHDDILYVIPGGARQKTWWRNLRGGASVDVALQGHRLKAGAEVLKGYANSKVIAEALKLFLQRFPAAARLHSVRLNADGTFNEESLNQAAASVILVRLQLKEGGASGFEAHV